MGRTRESPSEPDVLHASEEGVIIAEAAAEPFVAPEVDQAAQVNIRQS